MATIKAYAGTSNKFIFVSYAHLDSETVLPIIGYLQRRGYNVWFDEGIAIGRNWDDSLGWHIDHCACMLAFISHKSAASPECTKEIRRALDGKKNIVSVFLDPNVKLHESIADEIMAIQGIEKFNQPDELTFYIKLLEHGLFDSCHDTEEFQVIDGSLVRYNSDANTVVVPDYVTQIGYNAFEGRSNLQHVQITAGVDRIGKFAFNDTPSLMEFEVDEGNGFFKAIDGILYNKAGNYLLCYPSARPQKSYTVPQGVRNIALVSFSQAALLEEVTLPDSVTYLGDRAFEACRNLTGIRLGANLARIRPYTFSRCTSLLTCTLPAALESLDDGAFSGCSSLSAIAFPDTLQHLGEMTFAHCESLESIELPAGLDTIPGYCFHECTSLAHINLDTVRSIRPYAFKNCASLSDVRFSDKLEVIGRAAFSGCSALETLVIPGSVHTIGEYAFDRCPNLRHVIVEDGVVEIAEGAFDKDFGLECIELPASVQVIGPKAIPDESVVVRR